MDKGVTLVPLSACVHCGEEIDAATAVDDARSPGPGDLSVCLRCGQIHFFNDDMILVALAPKDFSLLPVQVRRKLRRVVAAIHARS